jgi:hypothetical protein
MQFTIGMFIAIAKENLHSNADSERWSLPGDSSTHYFIAAYVD